MPRFAIRVLHPARYAGDIFECARLDTRDEYEAWRLTLGNPSAFEVVDLDDDGQVIA